MKPLPLTSTAPELASWLDANAEAIDAGQTLASEILPRLGRAGLFGIGVPTAEGGLGGTTVDAIEAVASVAAHSLTAAFFSGASAHSSSICFIVPTNRCVRVG